MVGPAAQGGCSARRARSGDCGVGESYAAGSPTKPNEAMRRHQQPTMAGGYGAGDTPVPFPNTAVKPRSADGTAGLSGGRVRRRQPSMKNEPVPVFRGGLVSFSGASSGGGSVLERLQRRPDGGRKNRCAPKGLYLGRPIRRNLFYYQE